MVVFEEDEGVHLCVLSVGAGENFGSSGALERSEEEEAVGIDLDDVAHSAVAEGALAVEKDDVIPRGTEKLVFGQGSTSDFLTGVSDRVREHGASKSEK